MSKPKNRQNYLHCHMLMDSAAANPQRNKQGDQKKVHYGNAQRGMITSAALKRQMVAHFRNHVSDENHGVNTRRWRSIADEAMQLLDTEEYSDVTMSEEQVRHFAVSIWGMVGIAEKDDDSAEQEDDNNSEKKEKAEGAVLLIPRKAIVDTAHAIIQQRELLAAHFEVKITKPKKPKKSAPEAEHEAYARHLSAFEAQEAKKAEEKEAVKKDPALKKEIQARKKDVTAIAENLIDAQGVREISIVGRMMAKMPVHNVEAALNTSNTITATPWRGEVNEFTRVDELAEPGDPQSGHLGQHEIGSGTYYAYCTINVTQLAANLGVTETEVISDAMAILEGMYRYVPKSRRTSTAANSYPIFTGIEVNQQGQGRMLPAFIKAVRATGDEDEHQLCVEKLLGYHTKKQKMFNADSTLHWASMVDVELEATDEEGNTVNTYAAQTRHDSIDNMFKTAGEEARQLAN